MIRLATVPNANIRTTMVMPDQQKPADFTHTAEFPRVLSGLGSSLLVSTYQAGQVCTFGTIGNELSVALESFSVAMGIAANP